MNMWRSSTDTLAVWGRLMQQVESLVGLGRVSGPGHWAFGDCLEVGVPCSLTWEETKSHLALYAVTSQPLILGNDLREGCVQPRLIDIIGNDQMLAINQEFAGFAGDRVFSTAPGQEIWAKPLKHGRVGVVIFNRHGSTPKCWNHAAKNVSVITCPCDDNTSSSEYGGAQSIAFNFSVLPAAWLFGEDSAPGAEIDCALADVWTAAGKPGSALGHFRASFLTRDVPPHGVRFLMMSNCTTSGDRRLRVKTRAHSTATLKTDDAIANSVCSVEAAPPPKIRQRIMKSDDESVVSAGAPVPLPAGWNLAVGVAICVGRPSPCPSSCANVSHADPAAAGQCLWPLKRDGYDDGAWATTECAKMADCSAVTCGPAGPHLSGTYCAARSQFKETCVVAGYNSYVHGPGTPKPAPFRLHTIFSDHMVLQIGPLGSTLSGFAPPHAPVVAQIDGVEAASATATAAGAWQVVVHAPQTTAASPCANFTLKFTTTGSLAPLWLHDVLFGDVWLCSGQSNMAFTIAMQATGRGPLAANASAEAAASSSHPHIRLFNTGIHHSFIEVADFANGSIDLPWSRPSPEILGTGADVMGNHGYSAVCWMFGRELAQATGKPVGLVSSTNGGSAIESWMSPEILYGPNGATNASEGKCPGRSAGADLKAGVVVAEGDLCPNSASPPTSNFLGQLSPLTRMTIKGAVFYQGESNSYMSQNSTYSCRFAAMLDDWRQRWHRNTGNTTSSLLPFGFVQIGPSCGYDSHVFRTRIGQTGNELVFPNDRWPGVFMATAIDLPNTGDTGSPAGNVHLMDKPAIAHRLALGARAMVYQEDVVSTGPQLLEAVADSTRSRFTLTFDTGQRSEGGLDLRGTQPGVTGFEVFDNLGWGTIVLGTWVPAQVVSLGGCSGHSICNITLEAFSILEHPTMIRYAHKDTPCPPHDCLVYNSAGLPLAPFEVQLRQ